jgi:hypothetical protein
MTKELIFKDTGELLKQLIMTEFVRQSDKTDFL